MQKEPLMSQKSGGKLGCRWCPKLRDSELQAWAPYSGILPSDFVVHDDIEALDEFEEENAISNGNDESLVIPYEPIEHMQQKRKFTDAGSSQFKSGKRKSLKQVGGAAKLSM
ncbi:hypothetical protein V6N12_002266 [Hibiscus sabdariffa]|uniref:Uncharacterized protein n=1 Tax=Hibiscus sabdariffa TaxID=183260 RepID=A0ABR2B0A3_9ROSI